MHERKRVTGIVQVYCRKARDQIHRAGMKIFADAGIMDCMENIYSRTTQSFTAFRVIFIGPMGVSPGRPIRGLSTDGPIII